MASGGHEYKLVGFSEGLDRRPLFFVEPLPATRICSACGLVPSAKALLPCEHFFCKPCYEQCERSGLVVCPLDGDTCSDEEVVWINHPAGSILAKQVLCWNQSNGCNVVMAAVDISKHFHHECGYHLARCPKCAEGTLARDVCAHLESCCHSSRVLSAAAVQPRQTVSDEHLSVTCSELSNGFQGIYNAISMVMSSIQAELKEISSSIKTAVAGTTSRHGETGEGSLETRLLQEGLSQVRIQTAYIKDQLDEFMHNVNANQHTFHNSFVQKNAANKKSITDAVQSRIEQSELVAQFSAFIAATEDRHHETKAELDRLSLAIHRQYDLMNESLPNTNANAIQETRTRNLQEAAEAHAESLAQNASGIAWAKTSSAEDRQNALALLPSMTPVATRHTWTFLEYASLKQSAESRGRVTRMLEPVYLRGYCVSYGIYLHPQNYLRLRFVLRKGAIDQYLEWPFNLEIKWNILHPQGARKLEYCITPSRLPMFKNQLLRPKATSKQHFSVDSIWLSTAELESNGFISDGRMFLSLALEPIRDEEP